MADPLDSLAARIRACRLCEPHLPLGPRPVFRVSATARLLIVGQAPGTRVHETGIPWNDRSGDRLRQWLDLDRDTFYDAARIAIVPTGLCYPGRAEGGGDRPPRPECAPAWFPLLRPLLPGIRLTLLVGGYAQAYHLGPRRKATVTETVRAWREYLPEFLPLPHPSWRTTAWQRRNPWFEAELLPDVRQRVRALVG
ncbi:MAG: uracil-DNA glycosylase family protein [Magnetospirillum sp.]|nr:uracil-DNA glycosylase family protein [Magnetospirillum sp.]